MYDGGLVQHLCITGRITHKIHESGDAVPCPGLGSQFRNRVRGVRYGEINLNPFKVVATWTVERAAKLFLSPSPFFSSLEVGAVGDIGKTSPLERQYESSGPGEISPSSLHSLSVTLFGPPAREGLGRLCASVPRSGDNITGDLPS